MTAATAEGPGGFEASAALTGTFPGFTLRTHAAVDGISDIGHTLHPLWTGVGFAHVVQLGTSVT